MSAFQASIVCLRYPGLTAWAMKYWPFRPFVTAPSPLGGGAVTHQFNVYNVLGLWKSLPTLNNMTLQRQTERLQICLGLMKLVQKPSSSSKIFHRHLSDFKLNKKKSFLI